MLFFIALCVLSYLAYLFSIFIIISWHMCNKCHARITGAVALEKLMYLSHMGISEAPNKPDGHQLQACPDKAARDLFLRGSMDLGIFATCLL